VNTEKTAFQKKKGGFDLNSQMMMGKWATLTNRPKLLDITPAPHSIAPLL